MAIDTVTLALFSPVIAMLAGSSEHCAFSGAPAQIRATFPVVPASPDNCSAKLAVWPLVITIDEDPLTPMLKSLPDPESATLSGALRFAADTASVPVTAPAVAGENVMLIWHADPTLRVAGQLFVATANPAVTAAARLVSAKPPLFVTVTVLELLVLPTA